MATTRTPLQPAPTLEANALVGWHNYLVRYRPGQEDLARESIYRFARNRELAFTMRDAAAMGEQIPHAANQVDEDCECELCSSFPRPSYVDAVNARFYRWTVAFLTLVVAWLAFRRNG